MGSAGDAVNFPYYTYCILSRSIRGKSVKRPKIRKFKDSNSYNI